MQRQPKLFENLDDLIAAFKELTHEQSFRYHERVKAIVESAWEAEGFMSRQIHHQYAVSPSYWAR